MRSPRATFVAALTSTLLAAVVPATALAAPTDVHVRVEGATTTLFDRVVRTDAITLQTPNDVRLGLSPHVCDGTNADRYPTPGPTPTGATADAMSTIGQDLDAEWFGGFDDYFVTRIGTDAEDDAQSLWWGILVNRAFTSVGGCQLQVAEGDEVLWVYDAFGGRPFLWLLAPATTTVGTPTTVTVLGSASSTENPEADGTPYEAATVGGIDADARPVTTGFATGGPTSAAGTTTVTFSQPGWHRLKARDDGPGPRPRAISSNSVDVCVEAVAGDGCSGLPPSQRPVVPERLKPDEPRPPVDEPGDPRPPVDPPVTPPTTPTTPAPPPTPNTAPVRLSAPQLDGRGPSGQVSLTWSVLEAGVGVRDWTVAARPLGVRGANWTQAASGTAGATQAQLRLSAGRSYAVRLSLTDALGRVTTAEAGSVLVPLDDRARALRFSRGWRRRADAGAWLRSVTAGSRGATLRLRLGAGRPAFALRATRGDARIEVRAGGRRQTFRVAGSPRAVTRTVTAASRTRAGEVSLRVLSGSVEVDGAGLAP